eukprot:TRINITY_DN93790_c0_g1_i1.p1 TRINITY_DN93790_c0_g1~~TRINITY_DN93790_c0_g1_i1.p1  ORF type:complete len:369 (+),score=52.53 TRINITY_DN93790_c0_g1_i1:98-1204(+)
MASETDRLVPSSGSKHSTKAKAYLHNAIPVVGIGSFVILCSASMINLNKELMKEGVFPYVVPLVLTQFLVATMINAVLMIACPSLYPSLKSMTSKGALVNQDFMLRSVMPVALAFLISLAMSNLAYYYSSVPFLQMMKEANIMGVYLISLMMGLEKWSLAQVGIIVALFFATFASIDGELHFSLKGFLIQGIACAADACKNIMASLLLSGEGGKKLDAMSFNALTSPAVLIMVTGLILFDRAGTATGIVEIPPWEKFVEHRHLLAANALLAFVLNLLIAVFLRYSSALSFAIVGIIKDIIVVISSTIIMRDAISQAQVFSFSLQVLLVISWTVLKSFPKEFEHGVAQGLLCWKKQEETSCEPNPPSPA